MSDSDPAWMEQGFEQRKPAPRMKAVLAAIDGGAPLGLLGSTYWTASLARHRDAAKSAAELLKETRARAARPDFVVAAFDVVSSEAAHGAFLPLMREVFGATTARPGRSWSGPLPATRSTTTCVVIWPG